MRIVAFLAGLALIGATWAPAAQAQDIGSVATLTPQMQGQAPGGALRTLRAGARVVANQRIVTGAAGRGQLLFADETTLSVANRSDIVLDRFVYDPNQGTGAVGLTLTRGALRLIGGQATKRRPALIATPTGTISVRGSSVLVLHENGRTIAVMIAGDRLCFQPAGGRERCTNRRGGVLDETGYLGKVGQAFLTQILARIDGAVQGTPGGPALDTGLDGENPSHRGPVSSSGETYDPFAPDKDFGTRTLEGLLPDDPFNDVAEDPEVTIPEDEPCLDQNFLDLVFEGDINACLAEFGTF